MEKYDIEEEKLDALNYDIFHVPNSDSAIKIYTGTTKYSFEQINSNIQKYKQITENVENKKIFTDLKPSTITAKGLFNNIDFKEEDIIDMLTTPTGGYILSIVCNHGEHINPNPNYKEPPPKVRISNRGRKPKEKTKTRRKIQGSGKYFSSQITFNIYSTETRKVYKIKLFRNGGFQVPGIQNPNMTDIILPLTILREYLRKEFLDDTIEIQYIISVMRNYICKISNPNILIRLNEIERIIKNLKENENYNEIYDYIDTIAEKYNISNCECIKEYIGKKNVIGLAELQNNCERYFGLILKFHRPVPWKLNKRTTIKILRSGKINIDGSNSIEESFELYYWLENLFNQYYSHILYVSNGSESINLTPENSDTDSGVSIYDDDLPE